MKRWEVEVSLDGGSIETFEDIEAETAEGAALFATAEAINRTGPTPTPDDPIPAEVEVWDAKAGDEDEPAIFRVVARVEIEVDP